jgi:hypothetical protein
MERSVWRHVLPSGQTTWSGDRVERPSLTFPTDSGSSSSCRRVEPRLGPNRLKTWPTGLGFGPLGPRVKYTPVVVMILTFGQLHFVIP